jgi:hypothetical protein
MRTEDSQGACHGIIYELLHHQRLNLLSLNARRLRGRPNILLYKIMFGLIGIDVSKYFRLSNNVNCLNLRRNAYQSENLPVNHSAGRLNLAGRRIPVWNNLIIAGL